MKNHKNDAEAVSTLLPHQKDTAEIKRLRPFVCISVELFFGILFSTVGIIALKYPFNEFLLSDWLNMRPGLPKYDLWKTPIIDVPLKVYVVNITNAEDFLSGKDSKLKLEEVGPITYMEVLSHTDVEFHENSTLSYTSSRKIVYPEHLNDPEIMNKTIVTINLLAYGVIAFLNDAGYFANFAAKMMLRQFDQGPFMVTTVYDSLWNLGGNEAALWNFMKSLTGKTVVPMDAIGALAVAYYNYSHRINVNIGTENGPEKFFSINTIDHKASFPNYNPARGDCNVTIEAASEGYFFPQSLTKASVLKIAQRNLCRPFKLYFNEEVRVGPVLGYKYTQSDDFCDRKNPPEVYECDRDSKPPVPNGICDVSKCVYKFPFALSKVWYLGRNETWMQKLDYPKPNRERHDNYIIAEPNIGIAMSFSMGAMMNFVVSKDMSPVYSEDFQRLRGMVIPVSWLKYELEELPSYAMDILDVLVNKLPTVDVYFGPIMLGLGMIFCGLVLWTLLRHRRTMLLRQKDYLSRRKV